MTVHVVSHTHWDREWYHPAERFRQRLVALIDELLDDPPDNGGSFLLDGQTVVLEDYLEVRPERASEIASALREGKLEAGPWFVLADELIPSGEGLVRNLLAGRRTLRALRAQSPPVLYCPDSFGHPAALPALARGFDKPLIILWRGFGGSAFPKSDSAWWKAPDGEKVLLYHLSRSGYELGANLPANGDIARDRWKRVRAELADRSKTGCVLLMNGADHHARQRGLEAALRTLKDVAKPDTVVASNLTNLARELEQRATAKSLPEVNGELRDSYGYTWTLQGTLASRTSQKRRYVLVERMLVRDVEPWVALAAFYGSPSRRHLVDAAWKPLLLCQPHDTLCGCAIDAVARAMDSRLERAAVQGAGLREDALLDLLGHDRDAARVAEQEWRSILVIRNQAARARSGIALVEVTLKTADVPIGRGSKHVDLPSASRPWLVPLDGANAGEAQLLNASFGMERTEAPRAYPDNDAVVRVLAATWVDDVPALGVSMRPIAPMLSSAPRNPVTIKGRVLSNGILTLDWDGRGRMTLAEALPLRGGRSIRHLIEWESRQDFGDLYTPSVRTKKFVPRHVGTKVVHRGPIRGVVEQGWRFASKHERIDVTVQFILDADARLLRILVLGENDAADHRLRLRVRTDIRDGLAVADAAFGLVERQPINAPASATREERPVTTMPLHRYVSLFNAKRGATLFSDGLTECEAQRDGFAVTLLRCVGELSRSDLPERPGHAGWPAPTPEAQCFGAFEAELALMLHGPRNAATTDEIERAADDVLFPLGGETLRSALRVALALHGVALEGAGLAFSTAKESEDGEWMVLRCVNLLDMEVNGAWRLGRPLREAHIARLDETPTGTPSITGNAVSFLAPPRGIVTILVR